MADLYGAASQESAVSSYLSAASPAPSTGFSHSLGVSELFEECYRVFPVMSRLFS